MEVSGLVLLSAIIPFFYFWHEDIGKSFSCCVIPVSVKYLAENNDRSFSFLKISADRSFDYE